jgi:hypothetical protein
VCKKEEPVPEPPLDGPEAFVDRRLADHVRSDSDGAPLERLLRFGLDSVNGTLILGPTTVCGDLVGRDRSERAGNERGLPVLRSGRVADDRLRDVAAVHVRPSYYERARAVLRRRRVVVLRGRPSCGKATTGLRLLDEQVPARVWLVDPDIDVRAVNPADVETDRGYLIDTIRPAGIEGIRGFDLVRLGNLLRERGSYLAITADDQVPMGGDVEDYVVDCGDEVPNPELVLRGHLTLLLGPDRTEARDALTGRQWVQRRLHPAALPRDVERLARVLEAVYRGLLAEQDAPARFGTFLRQEVTTWLARRSPLETWAFRIALAVCNGEPYDIVLRVARLLEERLRRAGPTVGQDRPVRAAFEADRTTRLAEARARVVASSVPRNAGQTPVETVETVEFLNPGYPAEVLRTVWCEYDDEREPLLAWLRALGSDLDVRVRVRAAVAVGTLGDHAPFGSIRDAVLDRWAASAEPWCRESAAAALRPPAEEGSSAPAVLETLRHWARPTEPPERQATAARAYGETVGPLFPERALRGLRSLAASGHPMVQTAVVAGMVELFEQGRQRSVVRALFRWTAEAGTGRAQAGRYAFLALAASSVPGPQGERWPALLQLVDRDRRCLDDLAVLWRRVLNAAHSRDVALETRQRWVSAADRDPRLARPLAMLLAAVSAPPRSPAGTAPPAAPAPLPVPGQARSAGGPGSAGRASRQAAWPRLSTPPLVVGPTPVSRLRLLRRRPVPHEARTIVFRDAAGRLHVSTVDRRLPVTGLLGLRLRFRYDIDVSEQRTRFRCTLPCADGRACFEAVVELTWRIMDPRLVIDNGTDIRSEIRAVVEQRLRRLARDRTPDRRAETEDRLTNAFVTDLVNPVGGVLVQRGFVNLGVARRRRPCRCGGRATRHPAG